MINLIIQIKLLEFKATWIDPMILTTEFENAHSQSLNFDSP